MTAPSIRALGAMTVGPSATPTFAEPAGAQPTDVIVCAWFQDDARTTISPALPAGFAAAPDTPQANNPLVGSSPDHSLQVYCGRRSAVGAGPYVFTVVPGLGGATPFIEGRAAAVQDCATVGSFFDAADGNTTGSTNNTVAPLVSATSTGNDRFAFYMATNWNGGAWTDPAGFINVMNSTNRLLTWDDKTLATPQTVTPQAVNAANQRMNAWVGIFLPVASAVTVTGSAAVDLGALNVAATGKRTALGRATVNLGSLALNASAITGGPVILPDDMYRPGPCRNYEYVSFCTIPTEAAAVSGYALEAASEIIYYAGGQRFDTCQVTIRPCRKDCYGESWPRLSGGWWEFGTWPQPALINGLWYNIACGACGTNCSCSVVSETILPGPVQEIIQVTVDGVVLDPVSDYRLDDYRKLVRLGGVLWPLCNDLTKGITETGTWSVTALYGEPLPTLGKLAVGQLFCQILNDLVNNECSLPDNVTDITRQGLSFTLPDVQDAVEAGFENLRYVDKFIQRFNPHKLMARPKLYDVDGPDFRVTGTTI